MAHRINVADLPKLLALVVSFFRKIPPVDIFIITISTIFNKYKKQKSKIVEIVEKLLCFQQFFNSLYFSTKT
jgi:Na+/serine symporter